MTKAAGRRADETSSEQSQEQGPETWAVALLAGLMALALIALVVLAAH
jgi:hypothetical protein